MINRSTGQPITEDAHISQSVGDILGTPVGSREHRRQYGSLLPELIDHPGNPANRLRLQAATVIALLRWEPRIQPTAVTLRLDQTGKGTIDIDAIRRTGARAGQRIAIAYPLQ